MKMMVCYEGREHDENYLKQASDFVKSFQGSVHFISCVLRDSHLQDRAIERVERNLTLAREYFEDKGINADSHVVLSATTEGEALMACFRENEFDMLMVRIQTRSKVGKLIYGSTTQFMILESKCPVVCIP